MSSYVYGKGGRNRGRRRITCVVCKSRRYISPARFDDQARHVCGYCTDRIPAPPYAAHLLLSTLAPADAWRPAWYAFRFVPAATGDDFFVQSVGWENMKPEDRARYLAGLAGNERE